MGFDIKLNKAALRKTVQQAFEKKAFSADLEYDRPECGQKIRINGSSNRCACGFILNVRLEELEL